MPSIITERDRCTVDDGAGAIVRSHTHELQHQARTLRVPRRPLAVAMAAAWLVPTVAHAREFLPRCRSCRETAKERADALAEAAERARAENERAEQELQLESELEMALRESGAPRRRLTTAQTEFVEAIVAKLELGRGRQQRAGWGLSDNPNDLPYIGAWDVMYASGERGESLRAVDRVHVSRPTASNLAPPSAALVSARQWVYGPGAGGAAVECVYAVGAGPPSGSLLVARAGRVTKLEESRVRLDEPTSDGRRAFQLRYTLTRVERRQRSDGKWETVEITMPTTTPSVGALVAEGASVAACAPAAGVVRTTYLSDVLWIVRNVGEGPGGEGGEGAVTVMLRTEAEALKPQNGADSPDGFDALRFGPSGRRMWMLDTGVDDTELNYRRGQQRMRADDEISGS